MNQEFQQSDAELFGRAADVTFLKNRLQSRGLTVVVGEPQIGKTRLLIETARQTSEYALIDRHSALRQLSLHGLPPLIGYVESQGEYADMLPRSVQDLYVRWLADATYREQARVVFQQESLDLVGRIGTAVGSLLETFSKAHGPPAAVAGALVKQTFERLAIANQNLTGNRIELPSLQFDDSRELLRIVCKVTQCTAVLLLDQWEKSPDLLKETNILDAFLRHCDEWPPCHIVLSTRSEREPNAMIQRLQTGYPGTVEMLRLGSMDLAASSERSAVVSFVRERVSAANEIDEESLLALVDGYPRVLAQWTNRYRQNHMKSYADLAQVASEANLYRYSEFQEVLPELADDERAIAILLALLPAFSTKESWEAHRPVLLGRFDAKSVDKLWRRGVLDVASPPSFGHAKRVEAALAWFTANCIEETKEHAESLIRDLAALVPDSSPQYAPFVSSLSALRSLATQLDLTMIARVLCECGHSLVQTGGPDHSELSQVIHGVLDSAVVPLLAIGVNNSLASDYMSQAGKMKPQNEAIELLLTRTRYDPEDAASCEQLTLLLEQRRHLAHGFASSAMRIKLHELLSDLSRRYGTIVSVNNTCAQGLFNGVHSLGQEGAADQQQALLEQLRTVVRANPAQSNLKYWLGRALFSALTFAQEQTDLALRDVFLAELRGMRSEDPADAGIRWWLAAGLFNELVTRHGSLDRLDTITRELWKLIRTYPDDSNLRDYLEYWLVDPPEIDEP